MKLRMDSNTSQGVSATGVKAVGTFWRRASVRKTGVANNAASGVDARSYSAG